MTRTLEELERDHAELLRYVDDAKRAAAGETWIGEPLPELVARLVAEVRELRRR